MPARSSKALGLCLWSRRWVPEAVGAAAQQEIALKPSGGGILSQRWSAEDVDARWWAREVGCSRRFRPNARGTNDRVETESTAAVLSAVAVMEMEMETDSLKKRIYEILTGSRKGDRLSNAVSAFILTLIAANVVVGVLETERSVAERVPAFFYYFEFVSIVIFSVEYVLRLWSCTSSRKYREPVGGRLRLMRKPMLVIDLIAILPFYLQVFLPGFDLRFIRVLRLFRIFRILRVGHLAESFQTLVNVLREKREGLALSLVVLLVVVVLSSNAMYIAEPETFSSVPAAMWWGVITITTIGYGDVYPVTPIGKFLGSIVGFLGVCVFALPVGILGAGFVEEMERKRESRRPDTAGSTRRRDVDAVCRHCGRPLNGTLDPPKAG